MSLADTGIDSNHDTLNSGLLSGASFCNGNLDNPSALACSNDAL